MTLHTNFGQSIEAEDETMNWVHEETSESPTMKFHTDEEQTTHLIGDESAHTMIRYPFPWNLVIAVPNHSGQNSGSSNPKSEVPLRPTGGPQGRTISPPPAGFQPAMKKLRLSEGPTNMLNRWDSSGSCASFACFSSFASRDSIPTLPGRQSHEVSDMKNFTWGEAPELRCASESSTGYGGLFGKQLNDMDVSPSNPFLPNLHNCNDRLPEPMFRVASKADVAPKPPQRR